MKTFRSERYLQWVRKQPCAICGIRAGQAHHEPLGENFVGGKPPDTHALPMCAECHELRHQHGVQWASKQRDLKIEIIRMITRYLSYGFTF